MTKTWTLMPSPRGRSLQSYRFLAAPPEPQTQLDGSGTLGWRARAARSGATLPAIVLAAAVASFVGAIGPDARWLPALGRTILRVGSVPQGVPYASAPSEGWHNVPVLAELTFRTLQVALGERGLLAAQIAAALLAAVLITRDARRLGATDAGVAAVLVAVVVGGLLAFVGIRAQLFGLVLFPALVFLLRSQEAAPSRRIWLVVPLIALWSNFHGSALVGVGLVLVYVVAERARGRLLESSALALASLLALCATPALTGTPQYYANVLTNEAAQRGYGLWAPLSLSSGFDLALIAGSVLLLAGFVRTHPRPWQVAAAALLAAFTVHAARNGIWLLLFIAAPAACALRTTLKPPAAVSHGLALVLVTAAAAGLARGPLEVGASRQLVARAIAAAHGHPILADPVVAEQIAQAGGRVWIADPLDAFRRSDQRLYLDWLQGRSSANGLLREKTVIVVSRNSPAARELSRNRSFAEVNADRTTGLFVRNAHDTRS